MSGYRTIDQAYSYIKSLDSETALSKYFIRTLCQKGLITVLNINSKYLLEIGSLLDFLKIKGE